MASGVSIGRVYHGALGVIKVGSKTVGRMRNISWSETFQMDNVKGIGTIYTVESPVTGFMGSLTCDFYEYDFRLTGIPGASRREPVSNATGRTETENATENSFALTGGNPYDLFEDHVLFRTGVEIKVYRKKEALGAAGRAPSNNNIKVLRKAEKLEPFAIIRDVYLESENHNTPEGGIAGHNQSFRYFAPVLFLDNDTHTDYSIHNPYSDSGE